MKTICIPSAIVLLLVLSNGAFAAQDYADKQREYDAGIARLRRADATVDVTRLRQLSTVLPGYNPYATGRHQAETRAALQRRESREALQFARLDLDLDYLDVEAHTDAMIASNLEGDTSGFEHHRSVSKAIVDSVIRSGDGKSMSTAYVVVHAREENAVLLYLGLQLKSQVIKHDFSDSFDVLTVIDPRTKVESTVYFNIDSMFAYLPESGTKSGVVGGVPANISGTTSSNNAGAPPKRIDGSVFIGKAVQRHQPKYPPMAQAAGIEGTVVVEVIVGETGVIESARAISGNPLLRDSAVKAAKDWVFEPMTVDGMPARVVGTISFNFKKSGVTEGETPKPGATP